MVFLFGSAFLIAGLSGLYSVFTGTLDWSDWDTLLAGLLFTVIGGLFLYAAVKNFVARQALDDLEVDVQPSVVTPGDPIQSKVTFTPDSKVTLNGIDVTLRGFEEAVHHHGTDSTTYENTISESTIELSDADGTYRKGTPLSFSTEIPIPEDAPPTFHADDNKIKWQCKVHIDIDTWPDWSKKYPVKVVR